MLEGASDVVDWCDSCNSSSDNSNKKDEYISSSCEFLFLFCQIYIEYVKIHFCFCITVLAARLAGKLSRPICLSILSCENISIKNTLFGENISINDPIQYAFVFECMIFTEDKINNEACSHDKKLVERMERSFCLANTC